MVTAHLCKKEIETKKKGVETNFGRKQKRISPKDVKAAFLEIGEAKLFSVITNISYFEGCKLLV